MALSSGLFFNGFGFFFEPLRHYFGWSRTVLSGAYSVSRAESMVVGPILGYLIQTLGPRKVMMGAFLLFGAGFVFLSYSNSIVWFYVSFLILSTGAEAPTFLSIMASINNWFKVKRSRAIGFAMLGLGLGGVVFPPILAFGLDNFDWRSVSLACGVFVAIFGTLISTFVRYNPERYGYFPDGIEPKLDHEVDSDAYKISGSKEIRADVPADLEFGTMEALKTQAFWVISIGHAQALLVVSSTALHQVPYFEHGLEFSRASAAQIVMVLTAVNMLGQMLGGFLADRFPKNTVAAGTIVGHSVAMLVLAVANSYTWVLAYAVIQGLSWGVRSPVLTSMRGEYFGRKSFPAILGTSQGVAMSGMVIGPLLVGYMADSFNYSAGFIAIAILTIPGAVLFSMIRKPSKI